MCTGNTSKNNFSKVQCFHGYCTFWRLPLVVGAVAVFGLSADWHQRIHESLWKFRLTQTSPSESKQAFAGENVLLLLSQCSLMFPLQVEGASTNAPRWWNHNKDVGMLAFFPPLSPVVKSNISLSLKCSGADCSSVRSNDSHVWRHLCWRWAVREPPTFSQVFRTLVYFFIFRSASMALRRPLVPPSCSEKIRGEKKKRKRQIPVNTGVKNTLVRWGVGSCSHHWTLHKYTAQATLRRLPPQMKNIKIK